MAYLDFNQDKKGRITTYIIGLSTRQATLLEAILKEHTLKPTPDTPEARIIYQELHALHDMLSKVDKQSQLQRDLVRYVED